MGSKDLPNPLTRIFGGVVQQMQVTDDLGLVLGCQGDIMHFGRPGMGEYEDEEDVMMGDGGCRG